MTTIPGSGLLNLLAGAAAANTAATAQPTQTPRTEPFRNALQAQAQAQAQGTPGDARPRAEIRPQPQANNGEPLRRDLPRGSFVNVVV